MESTTKSTLTDQQIAGLFKELGRVAAIRELKDGTYNTSYLIQLDNHREYVLKIAPHDSVPVLTYEKDLMKGEVYFQNRAIEIPDMPVAFIETWDFSREKIPFDYFIMDRQEGVPLDKSGDIPEKLRKSLTFQLARHMAGLHGIKGDFFGYLFMERQGLPSYFDAFRQMAVHILEDGQKVKAQLPVPEKELLQILDSYSESFAGISNPVFVHFDLWDGNVFVRQTRDGMEISGLIDFERGFYADPAADFSQVQGYVDLEKNPWFFEEYNLHAPEPFIADEKAFNRIKLFRLYLFLIMIVESYYRDVKGSYDWQRQWASVEFTELFNGLKKKRSTGIQAL
ncbi:MAG: aminoglycoside phosphotransferase family protein [Spirochaetales bacterium]|nr:aminoglycoside phosphotransferase family protein [Spirochaetales bacterium]